MTSKHRYVISFLKGSVTLALMMASLYVSVLGLTGRSELIYEAEASQDPYDIAATAPVGEWTGLGRLDTPPEATESPRTNEISKNKESSIKALLHRYGAIYGLTEKDEKDMFLTFQHESKNFIDPCIQAEFVGTKGRERSWGYVQIWITGHPDITKEQACDPDFAFDFAAKNWKKHKSDWWSSYRLLKKQGIIVE